MPIVPRGLARELLAAYPGPIVGEPRAVHPSMIPELIATGALTDNQFIAPGESWTAVVEGLELPAVTVHTTG